MSTIKGLSSVEFNDRVAKGLINKYKDLAIFIYSKLYEKSSLDYEEVNQYIEEFYKKEKNI